MRVLVNLVCMKLKIETELQQLLKRQAELG